MIEILTSLEPELIDEMSEMMTAAGDTSLRHVFAAARCGAASYIPIADTGRPFDVRFDRPTICNMIDYPGGGGFHKPSAAKLINAMDLIVIIAAPMEGRFFDVAIRTATDFRQHSLVVETTLLRKCIWLEMIAERQDKAFGLIEWGAAKEGMMQ